MDAFGIIPRMMLKGLRLLDVAAVRADIRFAALRKRYYRHFWVNVAQECGAELESLGYGFTRLTRNGASIMVRGPEVRLDDHLTLDLMGNKLLTYRLIAEQGHRVPRHVPFSIGHMAPALRLLTETGRPLVVKPMSGTGGGRGVTTGIISEVSLRLAAMLASRFDVNLVAEEQIDGHSYRLLYLDGRLIDAVRRDPPQVVGDGKSTIAMLAAEETRRRLVAQPYSALSPLLIDREAKLYLASQGLTTRSVPEAGVKITVKRASNQNNAGENHAVRDDVHVSTAVACGRLARSLGVTFAGIDIIARDISQPLDPANGFIGEINTTPGLHHHHLVTGSHTGLSVGSLVAEHLFATEGKHKSAAVFPMQVAAE